MPNIDVVARLQLRAEQFSSETGARFAEMKTRARSAAQEVRDSFAGSFAEVQKLAQTALVLPRTTGGSLDLSSEIAELRQAAAATEQRSIALRELSVAQIAAAGTGRADAESMRLEADAAAVASLAEERNALAIRDRIGALEAVQTQLNRTVTATELHTAAGNRGAVSAGQQRAAMQQLGFQLNDVATSYAGGAKFSMIFAQQSGQVIQALSLMTNGTKGFLAWLGGPWGAVTGAAVVFLAPVVAKMFEFGNAVDDAVDKMKKDAIQSDVTRQAKIRFSHSIEGVTAAILAQRDAQLEAIKAEKSAAEQANITAKSNLESEMAKRKEIKATLDQAQAELSLLKVQSQAPGERGELATLGLDQASRNLAGIQSQIADNQAAIQVGRDALKQSRIDLAAEAAKRAADPLAQINKRYDDMAVAAKKAARGNDEVTTSLTRQLYNIEARRKAALKVQQEADRKPRTVSLGDQLENEQGARLLASAKSFNGVSENTASGRSTLKSLFAEANVNVDPKITAWCAAFVNAVLATNNLPGTGSLSARSFLGYGTDTEKPTKGDIVVSRRGTGDQGHVGFYEGTDAKGNVRVLGGNTADKVGTQTVARGDVLGFRRAPTAAESYKADEEAAKKLQTQAEETARKVGAISAEWNDQPRLIDKATAATVFLDAQIAELRKKPLTPDVQTAIDGFEELRAKVQEGLTRPYTEFVKAQREGLAVQGLVVQGRDVESRALQDALRLQQAQGVVTDDQLATLLHIENAQEGISRALENQQRIVGAYTNTVGELQRTFDDFLKGLDGNTGTALKGLISGIVGDVKSLERNLLSEQLFGGLERKVADYVRQRTGGTTPADMLKGQLSSAGTVLDKHVQDVGSAVDDFVAVFRNATNTLSNPLGTAGIVGGNLGSSSIRPDTGWTDEVERSIADGIKGAAANDNQNGDIVVIGKPLNDAAAKVATSAGVLGVVVDGFSENLHRLGIDVPKALTDTLKRDLPTVLQGVGFGQLGGSVFASITGGKDNKLASSIGGVLGEVGGKALGKVASTAISGGLGKLLGQAGGPIGSILGGIAGNLIGGLFQKVQKGSAGISLNQYGALAASNVTGTSSATSAQAGTLAGSVASGLTQIANALGGKITGSTDVKIGTYKDQIRVNDHGGAIGGVKGSGAITFATEEEAVRYAIGDALKDGVLTGISDASRRILASGQDLDTAIQKASLIESIPKLLKARLDPVGAAVDDVTEKFDKIFAALKEGGATVQQTADAQKLFNLELADAKTNTASASASLKSFFDGLKAGSSSPLSLRDQEAAAKAALQPYLDQIGGGQSIDQDKYQAAAQTYLDIERQLNGSTSAFFAEFDKVQAATAKAIATIDGVQPISTSNAAITSTATNTAATAQATQATAEIGAQTNEMLAQLVQQNADLLARLQIAVDNGFIGEPRGFLRMAS